ncbi:MAG: RdgB/HAM1 family non-canonical purine NTP pyrophosphatase [Candidatus Nealsonbacteria bacterium]|nr:RdgB/HAM1 family non-canonical purine NTP pyrophosphatase [Candidatus Nealsonbacteria bacterium]
MLPKYFATKNLNKIKEVNAILGYELEQIAIDLYEPQAIDLSKIISEKAQDAFNKTGKTVLVEDTAIEFNGWNGLPGALVKWFLDTVGNEGLIKMMAGFEDRSAVAKTAVAFFDGEKTHSFIGTIKGKISDSVRGDDVFGWDPIFIPDGSSKTFAEMTKEEKNEISMRKKALELMKKSITSIN